MYDDRMVGTHQDALSARWAAGFSRFRRIKRQLWRYCGGTPADRDKLGYGYDYNSNRTYRENTLNAVILSETMIPKSG